MTDGSTGGYCIGASGGTNVLIKDCELYGGGVVVVQASKMTFQDCILSTPDNTCAGIGNNVTFRDCIFENAESSMITMYSGAKNVLMDDCTFRNGSFRCIEALYGASNVTITNCRFEDISDEIIYLGDVEDFIISENRIYGSVTDDGIYISDGVNYTVITDNIIKNNYDYGIRIDNPTGHNNTITGNIVPKDDVQIPFLLTNVGSNTIVKDNIGFTTESSGLCTIASGDNSVTVNHNMSVTPYIVLIQVRGNLTAAGVTGNPYVDTITATQFTLHVDAQVTSDVSFGWKAEY